MTKNVNQRINGNEEKTYFLPDGKGGHVEVSAEVYQAYWAPVRREEKRKQREWRCRDGKGVRCNKDCTKCDIYRFKDGPNGSPVSLDQLYEENEYEVAGTIAGSDPEKAFFMSEFRRELELFLDKLNDFDRKVADAILQEKPDKEAMKELKIEKQSSYSYHKLKMRKTMQEKFKIYNER